MKVKVDCKFEATELAKVLKENSIEIDNDNYDFIIAYGGDGTALHALREGPTLAIRAKDSIGYISDMNLEGFRKAVKSLESYKVQELSILELIQEKVLDKAVNDIVLVGPARSVKFNVYLNGKALLSNVIGDGLIISTQLGSTGYNMSAGGPMLRSQGFCLTLNNPHSHRNLRYVLNTDDKVEIELLGPTEVLLDGRLEDKICLEGRVEIQFSKEKAQLVKIPGFEESFTDKNKRLINRVC